MIKSYLLSIGLSIFVLIAFDNLVSKTKNGKMVKAIISLVVATNLIFPIINVFSGFDLENLDYSNKSYAEYLKNLEINTLKNEIKSTLKREGYEGFSVEITVNEHDDKIVAIIFENEVIFGDVEHINKLVNEVLKNQNVEVIIETNRNGSS